MRVLLNGLQAGNLSGTGRYTAELARRLPGLATDVEVVVLWPRHVPGPHMAEGAHDALKLVDAPNAVRRLWTDQFGLRRWRKRLRAGLVHYLANIGPLLPMRHVVLTVHDLSYFRNPEWFRRDRAAYYQFAVRESVTHAARVIADSHATAADLHEILGVPADRIDVIPLGVGEEFQPASEEAQAGARGWYKLPDAFFLYVGTIEPRKNLVRVIEAWSRIAASCPYDLVIAGREGWKVKPMRDATVVSPHAQRIHFPGFIAHEDLPAVLSAARAFVWPSLYEGFGLPPLEAMACGVPVVTSNTSSLPEVVGDAALRVDPNDVEAIAEAMLLIATHDGVREGIVKKGSARAATFTWESTARRTLDAYRAALR